MQRSVKVWVAAATTVAVLLAGCGSDSDDDAADASSTTEANETTTGSEPAGSDPVESSPDDSAADETTGSETTEGETTEPSSGAAPVDVCATVDPASVEAVLGAGASAEPVAIEVEADGCVWESADGADVLVAGSVSALPEESDSETLFPLFGLEYEDYEEVTGSWGTGGVSASGDPGPEIVVLAGFTESREPTDPDGPDPVNDALNDISNSLDNYVE